jgi:hypothetical protein
MEFIEGGYSDAVGQVVQAAKFANGLIDRGFDGFGFCDIADHRVGRRARLLTDFCDCVDRLFASAHERGVDALACELNRDHPAHAAVSTHNQRLAVKCIRCCYVDWSPSNNGAHAS